MSEPAEIVTRLAADVCVRRGDDPRDDADMANARDDAAAVLRSLSEQGYADIVRSVICPNCGAYPIGKSNLERLIEEAERG
jgi:hypothetical protein